MLSSRVVEDVADLEHFAPAWDALADERGLPYCTSAWLVAWWRCVAPATARLLAVVVEDDNNLVGIAPFWYDSAKRRSKRLRLLGSGTSTRREPLFARSLEPEVARAVGSVLEAARGSFDVIHLEGIPSSSRALAALRDEWPSREPYVTSERTLPAPTLKTNGRTFDEWMSSRSSNFRQQMRKSKRDLERKGATFRMSTSANLERDLAAFSRLHHARWRDRGGSYGLTESVERMLHEAGHALVDDARFRLWSTDVDGRTISSHIFLAAGGEMTYWLGGFDEEWSSFRPSLVTILNAIEDAWERGDRRVDLGVGDQDYKRRFAEDEDELVWPLVVPKSGRYLLTRTQLGARGAARKLAARLPPMYRTKLEGLLRRTDHDRQTS